MAPMKYESISRVSGPKRIVGVGLHA